MKQIHRPFSLILCALLVLVLLPLPARADSGPKPSVRVSVSHLPEGPCWATLLSKEKSTGPAWAWDGTEETAQHRNNPDYDSSAYLDYDIWAAFAAYEDPDGYYFLQEAWEISGTGELAWTYYPPDDFKVLLYFPETGTFRISGTGQQRAFHTVYTVDLEEAAEDGTLVLRHQSRILYELPGLLGRMILTILVELGIALLFGLRGKTALLFITKVNVLTQLMLNLPLLTASWDALHPTWMPDYGYDMVSLLYLYVPLEFLIFGIEAALYSKVLRRKVQPERSVRLFSLYALAANAASFAAGLLLAPFFPGLF